MCHIIMFISLDTVCKKLEKKTSSKSFEQFPLLYSGFISPKKHLKLHLPFRINQKKGPFDLIAKKQLLRLVTKKEKCIFLFQENAVTKLKQLFVV